MHPGVLVLPNGATRVQSDVFQHAHDKTLRVFHEVRGVEQALIQQIILTAVDETYIIAMKNRGETGQFIGNVLQIFQYLQNTYGTILSSQLSQFEKEVTDMYYDPVTSVDNIFNKIEDLVTLQTALSLNPRPLQKSTTFSTQQGILESFTGNSENMDQLQATFL